MKRLILPLLALVMLSACVALAIDDAPRFNGVMDKVVAGLNGGDFEGIYAMFNEPAAAATPKDKAIEFFAALVKQFGKVTKISPPQIASVMVANYMLYFEHGIVDAELTLDSNGKIASLVFAPRPPAAKVPDRQSTTLRLPVEGTWYVAAGGETREQNYHAISHPSQRFACDLVVRGANGLTYKNQGQKNEDYYAYGRKVLAPAAGVVVDVISGIRENEPKKPNPFMLMGNAVIIQHKTGEFSLLAHLKFGSIAVSRGTKVNAGQLIGLCGNTGSAAEPQLHYSIMNSAVLADATGIKPVFARVKVSANGVTKLKTDYSPLKGDTISQG